eukprot:TRINITY_DN50_c0_g1_i7.p2 TRINITY_DN50_c0_g1~~TRINITY_DN50_c0_g1_i7.p2  ORF type:complete len:157 (+),score=3.78 TRINITY_DN50_c0_g1_i7:292-762(+)
MGHAGLGLLVHFFYDLLLWAWISVWRDGWSAFFRICAHIVLMGRCTRWLGPGVGGGRAWCKRRGSCCLERPAVRRSRGGAGATLAAARGGDVQEPARPCLPLPTRRGGVGAPHPHPPPRIDGHGRRRWGSGRGGPLGTARARRVVSREALAVRGIV